MGYALNVPNSNDTTDEADLIPEDEVVTIELTRWEGPIKSNQVRDNGKPSNDYMKLFLRVDGGDFDGVEFSDTTDAYMGKQNKTRAVFESFLNRDLVDGERLDFDDLVGRRCRALTKIKVTEQGGKFNKVKQWMKPAPRRQRNGNGNAAPSTAAEVDEFLATEGGAVAQPAGRAG